jgi:hypothetical protein
MKGILNSVLAAITTLVFIAQGFAQQSSKPIAIHAGHVLDVKTGKVIVGSDDSY